VAPNGKKLPTPMRVHKIYHGFIVALDVNGVVPG